MLVAHLGVEDCDSHERLRKNDVLVSKSKEWSLEYTSYSNDSVTCPAWLHFLAILNKLAARP